MVLAQGRIERFVEDRVRRGLAVGQRHLQLIAQDAKRDRVRPRRGNREIDELKHRLEIRAGGAAEEPFLCFTDVGSDKRGGARKHLFQIDQAELAKTAVGHDRGGGGGRDEVPVAGERRATGAHGPKENLILLERRRLEYDPDTVGQPPLGDAQRLVRRGRGDGSRRRETSEQRLRADRVDVRGQRCPGGRIDDGCQRFFAR